MNKETATIEEHAKDAGTPTWLLAATKTRAGWVAAQTLSRKEFDDAITLTEKTDTVRQPESRKRAVIVPQNDGGKS